MALINCPECNKEISDTCKKCQHCGYRLKKHYFSKKIVRIISLSLAILILVVSIFVILYNTGAFKTVEDYLKEGNYISAYKKAKENEKDLVYKENLIAYICRDCIDGLKDPSSFKLRNAYYDEENMKVILEIGAKNSYGGQVVNYWYYTYDEDELEYTLYTTYSSLEKETIYEYADSSSEKLEKALKNLALIKVKEIISNSSYEIQKSSVDNINYLFESELLNEVTLVLEEGNYL